LFRLQDIWVRSNGTTASTMSVTLSVKDFCPPSELGTGCPSTFASQAPTFESSYVLQNFYDGNYLIDEVVTTNYSTPLYNFALAIYGATQYDLGITDQISNNIFTSSEAFRNFIETTDDAIESFGLNGVPLVGANSVLHNGTLPVAVNGVQTVKTDFLCTVQELKSAAGFIVTVGGLAAGNFGTAWFLFIFTSVFLLKRRSKETMYCEGHHTSTSTPNTPTSPTTVTPYHLNRTKSSQDDEEKAEHATLAYVAAATR